MKIKVNGRSLLLSTLSIMALVGFTGCGNSSQPEEPKQFQGKQDELFINARGDWSALTVSKYNNRFKGAIQKAARDTLASKYNYFEILKPESTIDLNTYKQYSEKCLTNNPFGSDPCDITDGNRLIPFSDKGAKLIIKMYKEKPTKPVFNAQQVLNDMKALNDLQKNIDF